MKTAIYYFTGTGNSLHVAKELQKRFPDSELIPIISLLKKDVIITNAESVGFVFPIYLMDLPIPVKQFLGKLDPQSAHYIFAAATRISTFYIADIHIEKALKKKGKKLHSFFIINMAANSPCGLVPKGMPGFKKMTENWENVITEDKVLSLESVVSEKLDLIQSKVVNRERYKDNRSLFRTLSKHITSVLTGPLNKSNGLKPIIPFYADSTCNGCEKCKKICPSGRVAIHEHRPLWQKDVPCYYCFGCFNACPQQAILIEDRYEKKNGRYLYPGLGIEEISGQKG